MINSIYLRKFYRSFKISISDGFPTLIYIFKVMLASFMALAISLKFELEQPRTAMMSVVIVMHSRSGMVFTKSFYRLLGTLVGVAVSFVLVAMFAQERVLFLVCMAIWIGFCTAGSMIFRHHQAYGFVLAGYTICIVGLPATINPELTFSIGVTRISEIMIGLLCASLVSDLIFPQRILDVVKDSVIKRFSDFSDLLITLKLDKHQTKKEPRQDKSSPVIRFVGDIFDLESLTASSSFENDDSRNYRLKLNHLNSVFMEVSTTLHTLQQLLRRQQLNGNPIVAQYIDELYQPLKTALLVEGHVANSLSQAKIVASRIDQYRESLPIRLKDSRAKVLSLFNMDSQFESDRLDFETGIELLRRFVDELHTYAKTYASLAEANKHISSDDVTANLPSFKMDFDGLTAALAGLRGVLTLVTLATIWIVLDWRSGVEAITIGVVTSTLFASTRSPAKTVRQFLIGALIGTVFLYVTNFYLLPKTQSLPFLMLVLSPAIAFAAWVSTRPSHAVVGAGLFIIFFMHTGFNAAFSANPVNFMNDAIADVMAIALSGVMYELIDLTNGRWSRQRLLKSLRELVVSSCNGSLKLARVKLESRSRSLVHRFSGTWQGSTQEDRQVVDYLLSSLEVGHAVIGLRELLSDIENPIILKSANTILTGLARYFASPSSQSYNLVIASINESLECLNTDILKKDLAQLTRHHLLTILHLLRLVLLDEASVSYGFTKLEGAK